MKIIFLLMIHISFSALFSVPFEKWNPTKAKVGEIVEFVLEYNNNEVLEIKLPELGLYSENSTLPIANVIQVENVNGITNLKIQYLKKGIYSAPIQWKDNNENWVKPKHQIEIETNLSGNESEIFDIVGPMEFSGPFQYWELLKLVLLFLVLSVGTFYFFDFIRKLRKPKEASYSYPYPAESMEPLDFKLNELLRLKEIPHKEFAYILSDYIKSSLSSKMGVDMKYMTTEEISEVLLEKYNIDKLTILRLIDYMNSIKYMPNEDFIDLKKALEIRKTWEINLRL
jgi:hypothetical protein